MRLYFKHDLSDAKALSWAFCPGVNFTLSELLLLLLNSTFENIKQATRADNTKAMGNGKP